MSTGAGNDIERATEMARKMVCEWGMSDLGPLTFGKKEEQIFLGREIAQHRDYSEATAIQIDEEVRKMVSTGYNTAKQILFGQPRDAGPDCAGSHRARSAGRVSRSKCWSRVRTCLRSNRCRPKRDGVQQVLKPDPGRAPVKGGERPATA